jgi:hypothetical protein
LATIDALEENRSMRGQCSIAAAIVASALSTTLAARGLSGGTDGQKSAPHEIYDSERAPAGQGAIDSQLKSLNVRNARLEWAPPIDQASSVRLKFELSNDGDDRAEDLVLEIALVERPEVQASALPVVLVGPLTFRTKAFLITR